ncbi:MAG: UDP-N-acetylmuramoyl-L-alanyl-D-glutamate--2,6-diaminopimelate ligase [Bacteroidetes bacterium]|nr:UDP-N-acetylmuramoyl-L-alanyl-D-glutamate--2,6-diaminopimelate ligase [Bacteroidota bacterium]
MKLLEDIISDISVVFDKNYSNISINRIIIDSRNIQKGDLYVAISGTSINGHDFINEAISKGASAVVCEYIPKNCSVDFVYILTDNSRKTLGRLASNFYQNPSKKLKLIGVTGTNGKTTVCTLLYNLFISLGYKSALISTVQNQINGRVLKSSHTTPDAVSLNQLLNDMVNEGCEFCFMEVSSHAVEQFRIEGLEYTGAVFTNITHDHLDYHKTFENYLKAKKSFFDNLSYTAFALTNKDDKNGSVMLQNTLASKYSYSLKSISDFKAKIIESDLQGLLLSIDNVQAWFNLIGNFNAYNLIAVYGTAFLLGINKNEIITALTKCTGAKGRFEVFKSKNGIIGIVDYAHTPDALKNVLETINKIRTKNETLITIFGCGGNRDKEKRAVMGDIATQNSDRVIITNDNPRSENPDEIINQIKSGIKPQHYKKMIVISNREEAINAAVGFAKKGDIILLAGKGHENYQETGNVKIPFDDTEKLKSAFEKF